MLVGDERVCFEHGFQCFQRTAGLVAQCAELCEVCIEFGGRTECRTARGANVEEAQRTATGVACTFLASGMTDSITCGNQIPTKLTCQER